MKLVALLLEGVELSSVDFLDGLKLISVLLFLEGNLHILLAISLLDSELPLSKLVEESLFSSLKSLVLLGLVKELLLDSNDLVIFPFKNSFNVHYLGLVSVNGILEVLLHKLSISSEFGFSHFNLVGVASLKLSELDLEVFKDLHQFGVFNKELVDASLGLSQSVVEVEQFSFPHSDLRAQMSNLVFESLDLLFSVSSEVVKVVP